MTYVKNSKTGKSDATKKNPKLSNIIKSTTWIGNTVTVGA